MSNLMASVADFLVLWMVLAAPSATPWSLLGLVHSLISLTLHFFRSGFTFLFSFLVLSALTFSDARRTFFRFIAHNLTIKKLNA